MARAGGDGVLGAVGAPRAVARVAVGHARVAPPPPRRALRAQRRVRHRQRRPRHGPPRLRLLQPRPPPRPVLRRRSGDHAVRDGLHVRPRRPGAPPLPRGPHRERALLPASRRRAPDPSHGQVRQRAIRALPRPQGAGGGGRDGGAGEGGAEEDQEEAEIRRQAMRIIYMPPTYPFSFLVSDNTRTTPYALRCACGFIFSSSDRGLGFGVASFSSALVLENAVLVVLCLVLVVVPWLLFLHLSVSCR
ncbi:hypothetical protein VPH35_086671 [Triticum aestivum]